MRTLHHKLETIEEVRSWLKKWRDWLDYEDVKRVLGIDSRCLNQLLQGGLVRRYNSELLLSEDALDRAQVLELVEQSWARQVARRLQDND